jgi:hypothetical protein
VVWLASTVIGATGIGDVRAALAGEGCAPFTAETFPPGMVWWRMDPDRGKAAIQGFPEASAAYLVTAVRPDGVLVQNREAKYPRLLSWTVLARSQVSLDGRRTWRRGCAP